MEKEKISASRRLLDTETEGFRVTTLLHTALASGTLWGIAVPRMTDGAGVTCTQLPKCNSSRNRPTARTDRRLSEGCAVTDY